MPTLASTTETKVMDGLVTCETQGTELHGTVLHLTRHEVIFEIYTPWIVLRVSEALANFRIVIQNRVMYSGRALVSNLVNAGNFLVCEARMEDNWEDVDSSNSANGSFKLKSGFGEFIQVSQTAFRILPEFKLIVADMQFMLQDLRHWLEQVELRIFGQPAGSRQQLEREVIEELKGPILPILGALFERFEESCRGIDTELKPAHSAYVKRQLHPLVLCSPFMYRTFRKPLGYAGDYEMVNMMTRDPLEGPSVFAKVLNMFFLTTPPVLAHRNRIQYLRGVLAQEVVRVLHQGRSAKIFNLGCGPAKEIQEFISTSEISHRCSFTLLDFNEETLAYTSGVLNDLMNRFNRKPKVQLVRKAVAHLLKEAAKPSSTLLSPDYDVVYCAGLFDYMPEHVCRQLMAIFYQILAPGGLLVATNVEKGNPSRNWMEYSVDWHLIYRDHQAMLRIVPSIVPPDTFRIITETTGVNAFVEIRKPQHA